MSQAISHIRIVTQRVNTLRIITNPNERLPIFYTYIRDFYIKVENSHQNQTWWMSLFCTMKYYYSIVYAISFLFYLMLNPLSCQLNLFIISPHIRVFLTSVPLIPLLEWLLPLHLHFLSPSRTHSNNMTGIHPFFGIVYT